MTQNQDQNALPSVFYITHHKAGSQWVAGVLESCAPERIVLPTAQLASFFKKPIRPDGIYITVYVSRPEFEMVMASSKHPCRKFVIIRDLRDTLVSLYFSWKISHVVENDWLARCRKILNSVDKEQGLLYLIGCKVPKLAESFNLLYLKHRFEFENTYGELAWSALMNTIIDYFAAIQLSWLSSHDALIIRYEDLVNDEQAVFKRIVDYCQIAVTQQRLYDIVRSNSFQVITGRQPGHEDITAHQRKGIVGDWHHHFTERVKEKFKERFGNTLIQTGYERDLNW